MATVDPEANYPYCWRAVLEAIDAIQKKLHDKFGDKFGLEQFVYNSSTIPVTLICPAHGSFSRLPNQILGSPCGCPECGLQPMKDAQAANEAKKRAKQEAAEQAKVEKAQFVRNRFLRPSHR